MFYLGLQRSSVWHRCKAACHPWAENALLLPRLGISAVRGKKSPFQLYDWMCSDDELASQPASNLAAYFRVSD